jgi:hypothetical protein
MAYTPVTPAQFKAAKPQFSPVNDGTVQMYLDMAGTIAADDSWPETIYPLAIISYSCHLMTLDGLGTDTESEQQSSGTAAFQTIKSADLTLTRYAKAAGQSPYLDWLSSTKCGQFYALLLSQAKAGPRVLTVSAGCVSPYAKDVPMGWPVAFGGPFQ